MSPISSPKASIGIALLVMMGLWVAGTTKEHEKLEFGPLLSNWALFFFLVF